MPTPHSRFGLFNTEARVIHSTHVEEEYQIGIWLPFTYPDPDKTYPVLYVMDGDYVFGLATGLVPTLIGEREIPEMLVVGIAYNSISSWDEFSRQRERDLLPPDFRDAPPDSRTPQFVAFLKQELFPLLETEYSASPNERALYGFSAGGFFALYMLLTQPGLFRRTIAASCTWSGADSYLLACEQQYVDQPLHPSADLFLAVGGLEEGQLPGFTMLVERLQKRNYPGLRLHAKVFRSEKHGAGVISQAFLYGLRAVFQP